MPHKVYKPHKVYMPLSLTSPALTPSRKKTMTTQPNSKETISLIALTRASNFGLTDMRELYNLAGSATAVADHCHDIRSIMPNAPERLVRAVESMENLIGMATDEYGFMTDNGIEPLAINDERYPSRLRECDDAPLLLFYKGTADLNARRVISIVGTRHSTAYGHDLINRFVGDLKTLCPQTLVVSGLAYGVDICAHNAALNNGYSTVGVLAHGLDTLYPPAHKPTARRMVGQGGLLSEFPSSTKADKLNFVRRNRIVAGMADATVLVESAAHGGGLITTRMAFEYKRDVFAFPGPVGARYSEGCNNLIRSGKATLITSAKDLVESMGWLEDSMLSQVKQQGIERQLFPTLSPEEQRIVDQLAKENDLQANVIALRTALTIPQISALLFSLEMKGMVRLYAGGTYHLIK